MSPLPEFTTLVRAEAPDGHRNDSSQVTAQQSKATPGIPWLLGASRVLSRVNRPNATPREGRRAVVGEASSRAVATILRVVPRFSPYSAGWQRQSQTTTPRRASRLQPSSRNESDARLISADEKPPSTSDLQSACRSLPKSPTF